MFKLNKKTGETLIELITAMTLFGIIMSGILDFLAGQSLMISQFKDKYKIMFFAQKWITSSDVTIHHADNGSVLFSSADNILTVTFNGSTMAFSLE